MTVPFGGLGRPGRAGPPGLPTPPTGWPIGQYATYAEAQRAIGYLAEHEFTVQDITVVGVDLMLVERVLSRLTWGRVVAGGALSGAWLGLFVGILLWLFSPQDSGLPILTGLTVGVLFGIVAAAVQYTATRGRRPFASASQLVAGRYDVLCEPRTAAKARDLLAKLAMQPPPSPPAG